ncbi:hypothetical protein QJQ45_023760 [Haematococcus lacustris]|nr:hypothetical protein QJQ45_023760 [Haematococcus lacustris]
MSTGLGGVTECKAFAVVEKDKIQALAGVLRGLCTRYAEVEYHEALGAKQLQEGTRKGNEYHCVCEGHDLKAYLFKFVKAWQLVPGTNTRQPITEERFILEVTARVAEGQHVNAARAIGILAQKLTALVALQPAIIPM